MTQLLRNRVSFSLSFLSLLMPWAQQDTPGQAPPAGNSHRPHIPCATTTPGLQPLSAETPEQRTPNLPTPFLCLKPCLAQIQPLSPCFPQDKSHPLQTAAAAGPGGCWGARHKARMLPSLPGSPPSPGGFCDLCPTIPVPAVLPAHCKPKAKADTSSPAPTAAAAPSSAQLSSALCTLLYKKKAGLTPAPRKCLIQKEMEGVLGAKHSSEKPRQLMQVGPAGSLGRAGQGSFHRHRWGPRDPVGRAQHLLLTLLCIFIRMTKPK